MPYDYLDLNKNLTDEQRDLQKSVRKFSQEVLRPIANELHRYEDPADVIKDGSKYWYGMKKLKQLGYHTVFIPEAHGGMGLSPLDMHIFWEELACGSAGFAIACAVDCFPALFASLSGSEELVNEFTIPFVNDQDAEMVGCWAITEPNHGSDTLMCSTKQFSDTNITGQVQAKLDGDEWVINGQKSSWVSNGTTATHSALFLTTEPGKGMAGGGIAVIPLNLPGISRGQPLNKMGQRELPQGEIFFDNVRIPKRYMIATSDMYEGLLDFTLATANALMAACFTGVARSAFEAALSYSKERVQGGKPICEHQLIQDKLFKMFMKIEACRAMSRAAMEFNYSTNPPRIEYSIAAKVFCTQSSFEVASEAIQVFGGYGLTLEYPVEKIMRDARAALIEDGCNEILGLTAAHNILQKY